MEVTGKRKLNQEIKRVEIGEKVQGVFVGRTTTPWTDKDGTTKDLTTVIFRDLKDESRFGVRQDAGLKKALDDALVKEGDVLELHRVDKIPLSNGRSMNRWDVYALDVQ